jgi:hypothetical protein
MPSRVGRHFSDPPSAAIDRTRVERSRQALGAKPLPVDIDLSTQSIDVAALRRALEAYRVRAVIHVHLFGLCGREVADLYRQYGAALCRRLRPVPRGQEHNHADCATGPLASASVRASCCGLERAGAVATNSDDLAERVRLARHEGELCGHLVAEFGLHSLPLNKGPMSPDRTQGLLVAGA